MQKVIYFPLIPGSKRPAVRGWASPEYEGVTPTRGEWFGLRADHFVIVDCDNEEAADAWRADHPDTLTVKTPRGYHFYYEWTPGSPTGPAVAVFPGTDIRAGSGSYVVWMYAPGYERTNVGIPARPFDPAWLPERKTAPVSEADEWEIIPEGQRNSTLAALGGAARKQGMAPRQMADLLWAVNRTYCQPPLDDDEIATIAQSVGRYAPDPETSEPVVWVSGSAVDVQWAGKMKLPPPPKWYWRPYFPEGKLVFMDGREGIGKGMFCTWLATAVVTGRAPDGAATEPGNVLWLPTEDDPEEDILRRLYAAGYVPGGAGGDIGFVSDRLKVPEHEDILVDAILESEARLVIMDPGRSYLGLEAGQSTREFSFNNEAHVRPGMESLIRVAKKTGATILFIHHWNKDSKGDIFYRQSGSGGFNQVIRHRVTIARVERDGEIDGAFAVVKSNIVDPGHVHGFTLEPVERLETARFVLRTPMPEWTSLDEWYKAAQEHRDDEISYRPVDSLHNLWAWMPAGTILPSRDALMKETGLSQRKVDDALKVLAGEGLIELNPGKASVWLGGDD